MVWCLTCFKHYLSYNVVTSGQCTCPCFPRVSFTKTLHKILSKPKDYNGLNLSPNNPFPNYKFVTLPIAKILQMTILNLMKMAESSPNGLKTLIMSNFSVSYSVLKKKKTCSADMYKQGFLWARLKPLPHNAAF